MRNVISGDTVSVNYVGKLDNEVIFDSTDNRGPFQFEIGKGSLIPQFEEAIIGMNVGESKTVKISYENAYGPYSDQYIFEVKKEEFPKDIPLETGTPLQLQHDNGQVSMVKIKDVKDDLVVIDANHPLAGENLTFSITLMDIKE
jgi:peptidylprolyl isomerase